MVSSEELREAMEFAKTANAIDIELFEAREAEGTIDTFAVAVRELYDALDNVLTRKSYVCELSAVDVWRRYRDVLKEARHE